MLGGWLQFGWRLAWQSALAVATSLAMAAPALPGTGGSTPSAVAKATALTVMDAPPASLPLDFPWRSLRVFSVSDSLPNNLVYAIAQDQTGHVYAGLGNGLARYDGIAWQAVPLPGVRGVHAVGALLLGNDGTLWIGDDGDGVFRLDAGKPRAVAGLHGKGRVVYRLVDDGHGGVWAATDGGLAHCSAQRCQQLPALRGRAVRGVARGIGPNGPCLWIGMVSEGLRRFDLDAGGQPHDSGFVLTRADGLPNSIVVDVVQWGGKDGRDLWIATGRGLVRCDGHRIVRYTAAIGFGGSTQAILAGRGRDRGLLFVAQDPGGLAVIREDGSWGLVGPAQGLPDTAAQALGYTERGSAEPLLWIGTARGGLARADPERWQLLDERRNVATRGMTGLGRVRFPDGVDTLWMGSAHGTRRLLPSGWQPVPGLPAGAAAEAMASTSDGSLWVAAGNGLLRLRGDRRDAYTADNSRLPAVFVRLLAVQHDATGDVLWIGTNHGLGRWTQADGLRVVSDPPQLPAQTMITALAVAALGDGPPVPWIGIEQRLLRLQGPHWQSIAATCLRDATVRTLAAHVGARGGELWIGTDGPLVRLRTDGCERRDGIFPVGGIRQIAFDHAGRAWLFGSDGVARLEAAGTRSLAALALTRYGNVDGLLARDFLGDRGVAVDDRGRLWAATTSALQVFDPAPTPKRVHPPQLVWDTTRAGSRASALAAGEELPAELTPLVFSARLLAYGSEERNQYRIQLRGLQSEPQPWTAEHRFEFSRLAPGPYEALLWGRAADGTVVGPLRLPFRVLAPWWQRPWALATWAALLVACGLLISWWRHRALRWRARELAAEVAARTHELAAANRQLEAMARTDALTGLHNRRHATEALPELVRRDDRRRHVGDGARLLLVLLDVDHFKRVNDSHGHAVGDCVLREVASRLREGLRAGDLLVRWGGEEFLVAFDGCDPTHAPGRLMTLLQAVSTAAVATDAGELRISVSAGAAVCTAAGGDDAAATPALDASIARADAALYEAKRGGRDRAVMADATVASAQWRHYPRIPPDPSDAASIDSRVVPPGN